MALGASEPHGKANNNYFRCHVGHCYRGLWTEDYRFFFNRNTPAQQWRVRRC